MSNVDLHVLKLPDKSGERYAVPGPGGSTGYLTVDMKPLSVFKMLRPEGACAFTFDGLGSTVTPDHVLVAWFTDDAGFRWQLDEYRHLVEVVDGDESEYKP